MSTGNIWMDTFEEVLDEELHCDDDWILQFNYRLSSELSNQQRKQGWKVYITSALTNFKCSVCPNSWLSARGRLMFHYRLRSNTGRGIVLMRLFGQQCRKCNAKKYERPKVSDNATWEVLVRLISKIKQKCYGEPGNGPGPSTIRKRWTKPHESQHCEACKEGICDANDINFESAAKP
ncbi:receptor-transporting protein 4-like [Latimeria chalumnae]|uniref:receptor-transporting protein 4-like n=1 Tax=Latimeria chalumnae TaxID=7897 RepID=UPI0003C15DB4|nr:PREDICTED: receptor-transporting protein 4-like [Latimeria chalumnae]|eukprot:XP_006003147.1 PREDICTED: receptor-transporting protein 4-like [Latimeria chalumnae]